MTPDERRRMARELCTPRWAGIAIAVAFYVVFQTGHEVVRVTWGTDWAHRYDVVLASVSLVAMTHVLTRRRPADDG